jgi:hypothetical protein
MLTYDTSAYMFNVYKNQLSRKQEVGIWWVQKSFPQYGISIWSLWLNIRFLPSIVAEKNATKNIWDGQTEVKQYTLSPVEWGITNDRQGWETESNTMTGARLLNLRHPRLRFKSYPTLASLVRYDLNLTLGCYRFYQLAPLPVLDPISLKPLYILYH